MWSETKQVFMHSMETAAIGIAEQLPGLVAMLLILAVFVGLAFLVRALIGRFLSGVGLDARLQRSGSLSAWTWLSDGSPTLLLARFCFWVVAIAGLLLALGAFQPTSELAMRLLAALSNVPIALVIFAIGVGAAGFLERGALISAVNLGIPSARILSLGVKWLVVVFATAMALQHLGIGGILVTVCFAILFGGIVLGLALAVGLGSRDAVSKSWEKHLDRQQRQDAPPGEIHHL